MRARRLNMDQSLEARPSHSLTSPSTRTEYVSVRVLALVDKNRPTVTDKRSVVAEMHYERELTSFPRLSPVS